MFETNKLSDERIGAFCGSMSCKSQCLQYFHSNGKRTFNTRAIIRVSHQMKSWKLASLMLHQAMNKCQIPYGHVESLATDSVFWVSDKYSIQMFIEVFTSLISDYETQLSPTICRVRSRRALSDFDIKNRLLEVNYSYDDV